MIKKYNQNHKLSGIPTAYEELHKIIDSKDFNKINVDELECERIKSHEKAILSLINKYGKSKIPLVEKLIIQQETYQEALNNLLSLKNHETFETMMLLFEYMEEKNTFKLERLTGTELLRLGGYKGIRQVHRSRILKRIENHIGTTIKVLDPENSINNYKATKKDRGLVYKVAYLIKIGKIIHSRRNPSLVKELIKVEFLPEYIDFLQQISRRYIPLKTIRRIKKESSSDKTRHFLYKLCFKFASIKKEECALTLTECMNLGKFYNKGEHSLKRKWSPIERALRRGEEYKLLKYNWIFRNPTDREIKHDKLPVDLFGSIHLPDIKAPLEKKYYKYISKISVTRMYNLSSPKINLPFALEETNSTKPKRGVEVEL